MTAAGLGAAWALLVLGAAWRRRPPPARVRRLAPPAVGPTQPPAAAAIGRVLRTAAGRRPDAHADRRLGRAVISGVVVAGVSPLLASAAAVAVWSIPAATRRRDRRRQAGELRRHLPEVVDLLALAIGAGLTVPLAVEAVGRRGPGALSRALARAADEARLGRRLADALDDIPGTIGEPARPVAAALIASDRYGVPLARSLEVLAAEVRADRRRWAEESARRVPVTLLFPLVLCALPAFALLTLAPLLAGALVALRP